MKFKHYIFFFLVFILSQGLISQDRKLDSLLKVVRSHQNDTIGAKIYNKIGDLYFSKGIIDSGYFYTKRLMLFLELISLQRVLLHHVTI